MDTKFLKTLLLFIGSCLWVSCTDEEQSNDNPQETISNEIYYANMLGKDIMSELYYWNQEIAGDLNQWDIETNGDPIGTVDRIRYHEGDKYIDKWTMMTNDMEEKAGLKRGDVLWSINGKSITTDNYLDLYYASSLTASLAYIDWENGSIGDSGKEVELTAVTMYENPILCDTVYEFNGKKVGYLAYTSFDLISIPELIEVGKKFKSEGIKELVLDLRYNGGGYVITENVLASMFAPKANVDAKDIFEKEKYNAYLTEAYRLQGISTETPFMTEYDYDEIDLHVSTKDANIGLERIYGLISPNTASASEALLSGLMPYMDVRLIGETSHGKYCTGLMMSGEDAYENCPKEIKNWGVYVMVSIYQNAAGETPCMPDGLQPDTPVQDDQIPLYQLGDVNEPLLRAALKQAGKQYDRANARSRSMSPALQHIDIPQKPVFGKRILLPSVNMPVIN